MGKQKSFILVGSVFAGFIILMLLLTIISRNIKDTKIAFESEVYYVEIGKTRGLTPIIFAGGDVADDMTFSYTVEDSSIINMESGYASHGSYAVDCWVFNDFDENGDPVQKISQTPWHADDVVTVQEVDGVLYWHVNGVKTINKAQKMYTDEEIKKMVSKKSIEINCYFLNGEPTNIPYIAGVTPVRNESTKTWFIDGVDTEISYENCAPISLEGLKLGTTKITLTFTSEGKEFVISTNICVCEPDPVKIVSNCIDNTVVTNVGTSISLDYKILGNSDIMDPNQEVTYSVNNGKGVLIHNQENNTFSADVPGVYSVRISVPATSFHIAKPQIMSVLVTVIVLDTTDEQVKIIEDTRAAIENIVPYTASNVEEFKTTFLAAKALYDQINEENKTIEVSGFPLDVITNKKAYTEAETKYNSLNN